MNDTLIKQDIARPFVKWPGGKKQLIPVIDKYLPSEDDIEIYIEPCIGGGALFFHVLEKYKNIKKLVINDINSELINVYQTIKNEPQKLISRLASFEGAYLSKNSDKEKLYYLYREIYNDIDRKTVDKAYLASLFIFLNKTCYNGLYRVSLADKFNTPFGKNDKPKICDTENILKVSEALQNVEISCTDFVDTACYSGKKSLFYLDPPYRALSNTSNFTAYTKFGFNKDAEKRLVRYCDYISNKGAKFILSNSATEDNYFEDLFSNYFIDKVDAKRVINSNGAGRGKISELLITNYKNDLH
jgi:DNA adenine methylase